MLHSTTPEEEGTLFTPRKYSLYKKVICVRLPPAPKLLCYLMSEAGAEEEIICPSFKLEITQIPIFNACLILAFN